MSALWASTSTICYKRTKEAYIVTKKGNEGGMGESVPPFHCINYELRLTKIY